MTQIENGTWVLIADGEKALFLRNETDAENPNLQVIRKEEQENPKDIDQSANRPGRVGQSATHGKSAYDDTDWHELAKERFAADLADILYKRAHNGDFEKIILAAAPNILGELRAKLHQVVTDKVIAEIPKTLTNHALQDIEKILVNDLAA
ncbi:host attachment family protein [Yoonia sp. MH D7]